MNNRYEKYITRKIFLKIIRNTAIYSILYCLLYIAFRAVCSEITWYDGDVLWLIYRFLMDTNSLIPVLLAIWGAGFFVILHGTIKRGFVIVDSMLSSILSATELLIKDDDEEIVLSKGFEDVAERLNNVKTKSRFYYNKAKEEEKKKNDLMMYMAHDLKTPLTSVIGYLTLLHDEKEISEELRNRYLKIALDKALRLEELTNQFFEITRYNLKEMPINKQNINLTMLLEQVIDECYPMLEQKHLRCIFSKTEQISYFGDGDKLARAFENILKNAINYSYKNTDILIDISRDDEQICITFKNLGDKIPQYKLDKLFDKFYRADEARQSETGGSGLGLAIAKDIVELHGGSIEVNNDTEYIEFRIVLK